MAATQSDETTRQDGTDDRMTSDPPRPSIHRVTAEDLATDDRLVDLYVQAVGHGYWPNSHQAALEFACLAEKALHDDKRGTPGSLFYGLIKAGDTSRVTQGGEARALERFPSHRRAEMVDAASAATDVHPVPANEIGDVLAVQDGGHGYAHAVMVQCFLPQKATTARGYHTSHGRASLRIEAGSLGDPNNPNDWIECQIPAGTKPRLILPYIVGEAVRNRSPEIDLGRSLREFMRKVGVPIAGPNARSLTEQVQNIAAATILISEWTETSQRTRRALIADDLSFWLERNDQQRTIWTPTMTLSDKFFAAIQQHQVPINLHHLAQLARSPRRMDLYVWLAHRTARIPANKTATIPLHALQPIFAPDVARLANFRTRLRGDLAAIANVYRHFNVDLADTGTLSLKRSPPPVPFQRYVPGYRLSPPTHT